jgi:pimeloyl-ACP methyl ester carboxylesterase
MPTKEPLAREGYVRGPKDLRLYFRQDGEEGLPLVCSNGIGVSTFFWEPFALAMARRHRVIRWDYRGHGRSDSPRDPLDISIATCVDDLQALLDGLGIDRAVLLGHSMGSQVGFEFFRRNRSRVRALIPTLGPYRRAIETFMDSPLSLRLFAAIKAVVGSSPALVSQAMRPVMISGLGERAARLLGVVDKDLAPKELLVRYMEHMLRLDLRSYLALADTIQEQDATDLLPQIDVPVLVIAGEKDHFCPLRLAHEMVAAIPGAELLVIPNGTHAALIEQPELVRLRVEKFLELRVLGGSLAAP